MIIPIGILVVLALAAPALAQEPERAEPPTLPPITVTAPPPVAASSEVLIPGRDFELRPQGRPADMVRLIRVRGLRHGGRRELRHEGSRRREHGRLPWGFAASLGMRHLGDRFADEDRHQTARGSTLFDVTGRYRWKAFEAFATIENLTNVEWREAQFFFASRLPGEPAGGVPDIHFTPGNPRTVLGGVAVRF